MNITLSYSMPAITLEEILQFEAERNIRLSEQYRDFLLANNGGIPDKWVFDFYDSHIKRWSRHGVSKFYGLLRAGDNTSLSSTGSVRNWMAQGTLPIAGMGTADLVCLGVTGADIGRVYLWKHSYDLLIPIFDDFNSFIKALRFRNDSDLEDEDEE